MASTLWLFLCLLLFVHNLMDLLSDRYLLSYKIVEKGDVFFDEVHDLNYLACTPFPNIKKRDLSTTKPETQNVSVRSFLNHSIASIERRLNVTGLFRLNESFIFNERVCFPTTKNELEKGEEERKPFNKFMREYVMFSFFIYSKEKQPNFYERAYWKGDGLRSIYLRAYKQKVFGVNHLLNSHCSNRKHQIHHDRFSCLNRCFLKLKIRAAFYRFDDEGIFDLSEVLQEKRIGKREANNEEETLEVYAKLATLNTTEGGEECLRNCPEKGCFWEVVINLKINDEYYRDYLQKEGKDKVELQLNTYAAFYSMDDFYRQLFGLLALFTGTSVLRLLHALLSLALPVATRKIEPLLKNEKLLRIFRLALPNLKHTLTLLSIVLVLVQGLDMVSEFQFHSSYPNRTSTLNVSSEPFSVVICFPRYKENSATLRELSFHSIEKRTKSLLLDGTGGIEIYSGNKQIEPNLPISGEVLFKSSKYNDSFWLFRCFRLNLDLDDRLRKIPLTYLRIEFNEYWVREIFLIERNQNFTSGLVNFRGLFYPQKVTKRHSKTSKKSNCRDYSQEPNCDSRSNCLDRCLSTRFIEKHGSIPTNTVVSSSHLNSTMRKRTVYFNETVDVEIEKECYSLFNQTDCNEVLFEESPELVNSEVSIPDLIFIRLSYLNIVEREMEYDPVKTLLDVVGLATIFFGSNAIGMLTTVLHFLCRSLRLKWRRTYSMFLFLLATAGFLAHNVLVFRTIINGDLQENEFFEKPPQYSLPSPILCFPIGKDVDENHRVSEEYLDDLTAEMTFKHVFWAIRYNNRTYLKDLYIDILNSTKNSTFYSSSELELSHFYFSGQKCFKIRLKVSYKEEDFFLLKYKIVLRIYLNTKFANKMRQTTFLHQQTDSKEVGGGFNYSIGKWILDPQYHYSYSIEFELFKILRNDQFELLKDPRRLFRRRVQVNAETWEDVDRTTDQSTSESLDFEQNVANTYTNVYYMPFEFQDSDFQFSFSFLVRLVVITNRENYTKLVVSFLNTLSLWLDICVIDMGSWLSSILKLFLNFYRLLIKTSNRLGHLRLKMR